MPVDPQRKALIRMTQNSAKLLWMDALTDLATREKMAARVDRKAPNARLRLYVLPGTLAEICSVYGTAPTSTEYKAYLTAIKPGRFEGLLKDFREVDVADALRALRAAQDSFTIRALADVDDPTREVDILALKTPYLAKS